MISSQTAIVCGAAALGAFLFALRGLPRDAEEKPNARGAFDAAFHVVLALGSIALLFLGGSARVMFAHLEPTASNPVLLEAASAAAMLMAVSPLVALSARSDGGGVPRARAVEFGLLRFAAALGPLCVLEYCVIAFTRAIGEQATAQAALAQFHAADATLRAAIFVSVAVVAPIAEEVVFRGSLQPALARVTGRPLACLATACIFGALHDPLAMIPMGLFGYLLGRVRDAYGRLLPCIAIHAANNALMLILYAAVPFVRDAYSQ